MAEYIEREAAYALSKKICDAIRNREYHPATFGHLILDWIDDLPAADVAPIRHGRDISDEVRGHMEFKCSLCGCELSSVYGGKNDYGMDGGYFNFCPNCGCRMDLEDET